MTLVAHVTGIWCGQIRGGVGNVRASTCKKDSRLRVAKKPKHNLMQNPTESPLGTSE